MMSEYNYTDKVISILLKNFTYSVLLTTCDVNLKMCSGLRRLTGICTARAQVHAFAAQLFIHRVIC